MVPAVTSGVAFTINPITGADEIVDQRRAAGSARRWSADGSIPTSTASARATRPCCREPRGGAGRHRVDAAADRRARGAAVGIERHYGAPQDVEWCHDGRQFWIVQSRPVTTQPQPDPQSAIRNRKSRRSRMDPREPRRGAARSDVAAGARRLRRMLNRGQREFIGRLLAPESELGPMIKAFHGRLYFNLSQLRRVTETSAPRRPTCCGRSATPKQIRPEDEVAKRAAARPAAARAAGSAAPRSLTTLRAENVFREPPAAHARRCSRGSGRGSARRRRIATSPTRSTGGSATRPPR